MLWLTRIVKFGTLCLFVYVAYLWGVAHNSPTFAGFFTGTQHLKKDGYLTHQKMLYPAVIAHRGSRHLGPENTLHTHRTVFEHWADVMEFDVRLTLDNILVVAHDETIDRITTGSGKISDLTLAQLKTFDLGDKFDPDGNGKFPFKGHAKGPFPLETLDDFLAAVPMDALLNLEIKDDNPLVVSLVASSLSQHNATTRTLIASKHCSVLNLYRQLHPSQQTGACESEGASLIVPLLFGLSLFPTTAADVYAIPVETAGINLVSHVLVDAVHSHQKKIFYWVVNAPSAIREVIATGADGIITDRADLAHLALAEYCAEQSQAVSTVLTACAAMKVTRHYSEDDFPSSELFKAETQFQEIHECDSEFCKLSQHLANLLERWPILQYLIFLVPLAFILLGLRILIA